MGFSIYAMPEGKFILINSRFKRTTVNHSQFNENVGFKTKNAGAGTSSGVGIGTRSRTWDSTLIRRVLYPLSYSDLSHGFQDRACNVTLLQGRQVRSFRITGSVD